MVENQLRRLADSLLSGGRILNHNFMRKPVCLAFTEDYESDNFIVYDNDMICAIAMIESNCCKLEKYLFNTFGLYHIYCLN